MRKLLSLFTLLLLLSIAWVKVNAEWYKGDRKTAGQIHPNDTIILAAASNAQAVGHYLDGSQIVNGFKQTCPFLVVAGPTDTTVYLKQVSSGKYAGQDNGFTMVDGMDKAIAFTLIDGASAKTDNTTSPIDPGEQVIFRFTFINDKEEKVTHYLANWWGNLGTAPIWSYSDTAPWEVLSASMIYNPKKHLADLVEQYTNSTETFPTDGTDPGYFDATAAKNYQDALAEAQVFLSETHTEAEWKGMDMKLSTARKALENSVIQITNGYYYIISGLDKYFELQQVYKGMYSDRSGQLKWGSLNKKEAKFIFKITKTETDKYSVQNFEDESYINTIAGTSSNVPMSKEFTTAQTFTMIGSAQFNIANTSNDQAYHTGGHGNGAGKNGNIVTWNGGVNSGSAWKLSKINDQTLIDSLNNVKAQYLLNEKLSSLVNEGQSVYDANFVYTPQMDKEMITNVTDDGKGQIFSNSPEPQEGSYSGLIDKKDNGTPNYETYFHSAWSISSPDEDNYLQVDISGFQAATPTDQFIFKWSRRISNNNNRPTKMSIYATNDTANGGEWKLIKTIASGWPTAAIDTTYTSKGVVMDKAYKYVRFEVNATNNGATNNGHVFFTCSNFQMYPVTLDNELSQYIATPGMKDAADALNALLKVDREKVANNQATQADIEGLKAAIAAVKSLFADTTEYVNLRNKAQNYVDSVIVGGNFGELSDQSLATALANLIVEQKTSVNLQIPSKLQLNQAIAALQSKVDDFLAGIKTIEPNKWYHIVNIGKNPGYAYGKVIISNAKTLGDVTNFGGIVNGASLYENNPYAVWRFVPIEGSKYYGLQNLGTGHFLGKYRGAGNGSYPQATDKPEPYAVEYLGKGQMTIVSKDSTNIDNIPLHAQNANSRLVNWRAEIHNASAWTFKEANPTEFDLEMINHTLQIITLPFDIDGGANSLTNFNGNFVKTYIVKDYTSDGTNTTINLTQIDEAIPAGTPFILEVDQTGGEDTLSIVTMPKTEIYTEVKNANGIIGTLNGLTLEKAGFGYLTKSKLNISTDASVNISGGSGYFTPKGLVSGTGNTDKELSAKGVLDAIKTVNPDKGTVRVNVYTIDGKLIKSNVFPNDAKSGLNKGIYIIGKKKIAVK